MGRFNSNKGSSRTGFKRFSNQQQAVVSDSSSAPEVDANGIPKYEVPQHVLEFRKQTFRVGKQVFYSAKYGYPFPIPLQLNAWYRAHPAPPDMAAITRCYPYAKSMAAKYVLALPAVSQQDSYYDEESGKEVWFTDPLIDLNEVMNILVYYRDMADDLHSRRMKHKEAEENKRIMLEKRKMTQVKMVETWKYYDRIEELDRQYQRDMKHLYKNDELLTSSCE